MYKERMFKNIGVIAVWMLFINLMHAGVFAQIGVEEVSQAERDQIVNQTVEPFIQALQIGDVVVLEQLIEGRLGNTLGKLLRQNQEYPNFLRKRYGGTSVGKTIQVFHQDNLTGTSSLDKELRIAVVQLNKPEGPQEKFELSLEKNAQGAWKVVDKKMTR